MQNTCGTCQVHSYFIATARWNRRFLRGGEKYLTGIEFLGNGSMILKCSIWNQVSDFIFPIWCLSSKERSQTLVYIFWGKFIWERFSLWFTTLPRIAKNFVGGTFRIIGIKQKQTNNHTNKILPTSALVFWMEQSWLTSAFTNNFSASSFCRS